MAEIGGHRVCFGQHATERRAPVDSIFLRILISEFSPAQSLVRAVCGLRLGEALAKAPHGGVLFQSFIFK